MGTQEGAGTSAAGAGGVLSAAQWADLVGATGCFTSAVVDYRTPCAATADRPGHVVQELSQAGANCCFQQKFN